MDRDAAEEAFGDLELVAPFVGDVAENFDRLAGDFAPMPSPGVRGR